VSTLLKSTAAFTAAVFLSTGLLSGTAFQIWLGLHKKTLEKVKKVFQIQDGVPVTQQIVSNSEDGGLLLVKFITVLHMYLKIKMFKFQHARLCWQLWTSVVGTNMSILIVNDSSYQHGIYKPVTNGNASNRKCRTTKNILYILTNNIISTHLAGMNRYVIQ